MPFESTGLDPQTLLHQLKGLDQLSDQLSYVLTVLYSLDSDEQKKFEPEIHKLEKVFTNVTFYRKVKHRDALIDNFPIEYFGKDYGETDPYKFDEKLEKQVNMINIELLAIIGRVISGMKEKSIFIEDKI